MGASGLALAAHFATWVASLDATTLTHSLLFVTAHPLVIVLGMGVLARTATNVRAPARMEWIGAAVCFVGASLALFDAGSAQGDQTVTLWGDSKGVDANFPVRLSRDPCRRGCSFASVLDD